jgi:hypothetical protein
LDTVKLEGISVAHAVIDIFAPEMNLRTTSIRIRNSNKGPGIAMRLVKSSRKRLLILT